MSFPKPLWFLFLLGPVAASADVTLPVVGHLERAGESALWSRVDRDQIPQELLQTVTLPTPSRAFSAPYPEVFFQNDRIVVCSVQCSGDTLAKPVAVGPNHELRINPKEQGLQLRQANVYYWVNRMFDTLQTTGFTPAHRLVIYVDRDIENPTNGFRSFNNAFFNSDNWSLNFLLGKGTLGDKNGFAPSAGDPSVAIHEASHSVFETLIGSALNPSTFGLHEAFADYLALAILDTKVIGRVMARGSQIRDESRVTQVPPGSEAHELGKSIAAAMIRIRELASDPAQADRVLMQTLRILGTNPYATPGDVMREHLRLLKESGLTSRMGKPGDLPDQASALWQMTGLFNEPLSFPTDVLPPNPAMKATRTLDVIDEAPQELVEEYGAKPFERTTLKLLDQPIDGPKMGDKPTAWTLMAVSRTLAPGESARFAEPFWVLSDKDSFGVIHYAVDLRGKPLNPPSSPAAFQRVSAAASALRGIPGSQAASLRYSPQGAMKLLFSTSKTRTSAGPRLELDSGEVLDTEAKSRDIRRTFISRGLGQIGGTDLTAALALRDVANVTLYTRIKDNRVLGYTIRYMTGLKSTVFQSALLRVPAP